MIKSDNGKGSMKGTKIQLMADLTVLFHALNDNELLSNEDIEKCRKVACMSEEELKVNEKEATEAMGKVIRGTIESVLDEIFGCNETDNEEKREETTSKAEVHAFVIDENGKVDDVPEALKKALKEALGKGSE